MEIDFVAEKLKLLSRFSNWLNIVQSKFQTKRLGTGNWVCHWLEQGQIDTRGRLEYKRENEYGMTGVWVEAKGMEMGGNWFRMRTGCMLNFHMAERAKQQEAQRKCRTEQWMEQKNRPEMDDQIMAKRNENRLLRAPKCSGSGVSHKYISVSVLLNPITYQCVSHSQNSAKIVQVKVVIIYYFDMD